MDAIAVVTEIMSGGRVKVQLYLPDGYSELNTQILSPQNSGVANVEMLRNANLNDAFGVKVGSANESAPFYEVQKIVQKQ